ncbi:hypothetical protein [Arthrobacter sp. P2b]|uniref:hypothetical protein n=1 Tax=Arthrobacter sp. P2b TaxID=1938741 RepID=UPI0009A71865|nr:hypothetical protein [Arthrobacter sp. P2b]
MGMAGVGVAEECFCDGLVQGSGCGTEPCGDFAAVDDEGFFELVLHFEQFPNDLVGNGQGVQEERRDGADPGAWLSGLTVDGIDQFLGAAGLGVVGQVPDFAGCVRVFAQDGEAFTDVRSVGIRVGLVPVTQDGAGFPGQGCGEDPVTEVRLCPLRGPK